MLDTAAIIMLKEPETGFLSKEMCRVRLGEDIRYVESLFVSQAEDGALLLHLNLTTDRDLTDTEFEAVYGYYDEARILPNVRSIQPLDDVYNPTWEIIVDYIDDPYDITERIKSLIDLHKMELAEVYEISESI
jgi:hypothetical protein